MINKISLIAFHIKKHNDSASQHIIAPTGRILFEKLCLFDYFVTYRHNDSASDEYTACIGRIFHLRYQGDANKIIVKDLKC